MEEYFCLVGTDEDDKIVVDHLVKPTQSRYLGWKMMADEGSVFVSQVTPEAECPPGTIGNVHSHPWDNEPSRFDTAGWIQDYAFKGSYRFHAVTSKTHGKDENQIRFYIVHCSEIKKDRAKCGILEIMPGRETRLTIGPTE